MLPYIKYLNLLKAHLGCIWLTVDLLLHGKVYSLTDDESLNTSLVDVIDTLGEIVLVRDCLGDLAMLPREWYLRGDSILSSTVLYTKQNEERCLDALLFESGSISKLSDNQLNTITSLLWLFNKQRPSETALVTQLKENLMMNWSFDVSNGKFTFQITWK